MSHYEIEVPWLDGGGLDTTNCAVVGLPGPADPPGFVVKFQGTYEECDAWIEANPA